MSTAHTGSPLTIGYASRGPSRSQRLPATSRYTLLSISGSDSSKLCLAAGTRHTLRHHGDRRLRAAWRWSVCQNSRMRDRIRRQRILVVCTCATALSLVGFWISSLSHQVLAFSSGGTRCPAPSGTSCVTTPYPYWATTWPSSTWMAVICIILLGVWIAASRWLLRRLVSAQTPA